MNPFDESPSGQAAPPSQPVGTDTGNPSGGNNFSPNGDEPSAIEKVAGGFSGIVTGLLSWVIFPLALVFILHNFVFQAYHVLGTSMVPTLHESDYLIVSKVGNTLAAAQRLLGRDTPYIPSRGEVIVFHYPQDPSKIFVKRVIGVPGDRIVIKGGTLTVFNTANPNGFNPDVGYELADTETLIDTDETVTAGHVFAMGDNRTPGGSYDSREWGQLPSKDIIGDAVLRLLPLDQTRLF